MYTPAAKNKNPFILFLFLPISLFFYPVETALAEKGSLDLSDAGLAELEASISPKDFFSYTRIKEKLSGLSYEEISALPARIERSGRFPKLAVYIGALLGITEKRGVYLLNEDIFVGNQPVLKEFPFYEGEGRSRSITELRPYAEQMYFNNLRLKYKNSGLVRKEDSLWAGSAGGMPRLNPSGQDKDGGIFYLLPGAARGSWSYSLPYDNLTPYMFSSRQWIKEYAESTLYPVVYKDTVVMRNASRLYCVDLKSGRELWSYADPRDGGRSLYQTFSRLHLNMYGYELLISGDTVFTALGEGLAAVSLKDIYRPQLIWMRDLGEYSLCTQPLRSADNLIAGLINPRGELWIASFDCDTGRLLWSTYIGTCSFISPPCRLSLAEGAQVFVGTNHGVLVSLRPSDGEMIWLRKYKPTSYSLFDYWQAHFSEKGLIKYDTQFLEAEEGRLYYKPRESEYFYTLDPQDGRLLDSVFIYSENCHILKVLDGKGIFLVKSYDKNSSLTIKLVDLKSGRELYKKGIKPGAMKGVLYTGGGEVLCKIDDTLHILKLGTDIMEGKEVRLSSKDSWLVKYDSGAIFTADKTSLTCIYTSERMQLSYAQDPSRSAYLENIDRIKRLLQQALRLDPKSVKAERLREKLITSFRSSVYPLPLRYILAPITDNLGKLLSPYWTELAFLLKERYGEETVFYRGIDLKFKNLITASSAPAAYHADESGVKDSNSRQNVSSAEISARGDKLFLLPVKVIGSQARPDFFLLLNRDQLLCVDEKGLIRWSRKVIYRSFPGINRYVKYDGDTNVGRMYGDDSVAYLYNGALIINDRVNIIAVNAATGEYLWSMTNGKEDFDKAREFPPVKIDKLYSKYGIDRVFLKNIMLYSEFLEGRLIVVRGNKVYSIDPLTGYCLKERRLGMEAAIKVASWEGRLYVVSSRLDNLKVLNADLNLIKRMSLPFLSDKDTSLDIFFMNGSLVLHGGRSLYLLDPKGGPFFFKGRIDLDMPALHRVEAWGDRIVVIAPLAEAVCYRLDKGMLKFAWEFSPESSDRDTVWKRYERRTQYYFIRGDFLLLPFTRGESLFFACIDLATGRKLWEKEVPGVRGYFYDLSAAVERGGKIRFIVVTGCEELADIYPESGHYFNAIFVTAKLCTLELSSSRIIVEDRMIPMLSNSHVDRSDVVSMRNRFAYAAYGRLVSIKDDKP